MDKKVVLVYSGGSDSFTLLHYLRNLGNTVFPISFDYSQRHARELLYAKEECARLGLPHKVVRIDALRDIASRSVLTSDAPVPEGFYADENMKQTVVPNRNMILLALAAAYAINIGAQALAYGAHAGDHTIYPDCRPAFIEEMARAFALCDWSPLHLLVPFQDIDKRAIYGWGIAHGLDYSNAWTCYNGRERACGKCGSCVERLHAFHDIGAIDPLRYEDRDYFETVLPK